MQVSTLVPEFTVLLKHTLNFYIDFWNMQALHVFKITQILRKPETDRPIVPIHETYLGSTTCCESQLRIGYPNWSFLTFSRFYHEILPAVSACLFHFVFAIRHSEMQLMHILAYLANPVLSSTWHGTRHLIWGFTGRWSHILHPVIGLFSNRRIANCLILSLSTIVLLSTIRLNKSLWFCFCIAGNSYNASLFHYHMLFYWINSSLFKSILCIPPHHK